MISTKLQRYLISSLNGPYPCYSIVPEFVTYPYISFEIISITKSVPTSTQTGKHIAFLLFKTWSRNKESIETQAMAHHIKSKLCGRLLLMEGLGNGCSHVIDEKTQVLSDRSTSVCTIKLMMRVHQR